MFTSKTIHQPSSILIIIAIISTVTTNVDSSSSSLQYREAPKFYNSPNCPSITTFTNRRVSCDNSGGGGNLSSAAAVHVAMTLDAAYLRGSMAAIFSVLRHSSCPENTFFHFVTTNNAKNLENVIFSSFPYLKFQIYPFDASPVSGLISTSIRSALDCPLNYARNYLADLIPACVGRVVYLDSDLVLVDDVGKLAATPLNDGAVLAAPEYCGANFTAYFTPTFWSSPSLSATFASRRKRPCYFNTGVMVVDLARWREGGFTARIAEWMELQKRIRIYELGSLPPFLLVFAGDIAPVDHRWNQHGLGGDNFRGRCRDLHPGPVSLLHWSGKGKPWVRIDGNRPCPLDALWAPYDLMKTTNVLES